MWLENGCLTTIAHEHLMHINVHGLMDENQREWDEDILSDICNDRDRKLINKYLYLLKRVRITGFG